MPPSTPPRAGSSAAAPPAATRAAEPWTVRRLLAWIAPALESQRIDSPRLMAEMLVADMLGCERLRLYTDADREPEPAQLQRLRDLVARALRHEPIQYLTGEAWFFGLPFSVDRRVLIPRPSTETIVEVLVQRVRRYARDAAADAPSDSTPPAPRPPLGDTLRIADACTGSGCIAVAIAKNLPGARLVATDLSSDALDCAALNAKRHAVHDRIDFRQGHLLDPLAGDRFDAILANPPYIPDHQWDSVAPNVKDYEPHAALRGGADGLDLVAPIIAGAPAHLNPGGILLIEVAACTADRAADLARDAGLADAVILKDSDGLDRVIRAVRPA